VNRPLAALALLAVGLLGPTGVEAASPSSGSLPTVVTANPLRLTISLSASRVTVGTALKAKGMATDLAQVSFSDGVVTLRAPNGVSISGSASHDLGPLGGGRSMATTWTICGLAAGNYLIMLTGLAKDATGRTWKATSNAAVLTVSTGTKRCH
jgi:hypothetical protein